MERAELNAIVHATGCAEECGGFSFLCDPKWGVAERTHLASLQAMIQHSASKLEVGWLCVSSGGTGGGLKFARHDEHTFGAAVRGFCAHFELERVNAVDVLPAHHVSGLMARVRCAATGGKHVALEWKRLESGSVPKLSGGSDWVISLVPTQLQRLLARPEVMTWLRGFKVIFVGGGPVWSELTEGAARAELPLSLSYGMTETAAMVAALRPAEFLRGVRSSGQALPHASLSLTPEGLVQIEGESVFRGYFPAKQNERLFVTEDLGRIDAQGHWHILGRRDAFIITGGEKVNPAVVEAALRATGEFVDVAVLGVPDADWGEAVVACYPSGAAPDFSIVERKLKGQVAGTLRPKRFIAIADWPRNAQGKLNRAKLLTAVLAGLDPRGESGR